MHTNKGCLGRTHQEQPARYAYKCSPFLLAFLFRSGDNELNPGPDNFTLCTRSIIHSLHSAVVSDPIDTHNSDAFLLSY